MGKTLKSVKRRKKKKKKKYNHVYLHTLLEKFTAALQNKQQIIQFRKSAHIEKESHFVLLPSHV